MIAGSGLLNILVELVLVGLIFWLIWWFIGYVGLPQPFLKVAQVILGLCALIFLINLVIGISGNHLLNWNMH